jgi:hypothetical protein
METLIGFVATLAVIGYLALMVWFVVIAVRFLRSGRKAFDRYVALNQPERLPRTASNHRADTAPPAVKW